MYSEKTRASVIRITEHVAADAFVRGREFDNGEYQEGPLASRRGGDECVRPYMFS